MDYKSFSKVYLAVMSTLSENIVTMMLSYLNKSRKMELILSKIMPLKNGTSLPNRLLIAKK